MRTRRLSFSLGFDVDHMDFIFPSYLDLALQGIVYQIERINPYLADFPPAALLLSGLYVELACKVSFKEKILWN